MKRVNNLIKHRKSRNQTVKKFEQTKQFYLELKRL